MRAEVRVPLVLFTYYNPCSRSVSRRSPGRRSTRASTARSSSICRRRGRAAGRRGGRRRARPDPPGGADLDDAARASHRAPQPRLHLRRLGHRRHRRAPGPPADLAAQIRTLRRVTTMPVCVGFGISTPRRSRCRAPRRWRDRRLGDRASRRGARGIVGPRRRRGQVRRRAQGAAPRAPAELPDGPDAEVDTVAWFKRKDDESGGARRARSSSPRASGSSATPARRSCIGPRWSAPGASARSVTIRSGSRPASASGRSPIPARSRSARPA